MGKERTMRKTSKNKTKEKARTMLPPAETASSQDLAPLSATDHYIKWWLEDYPPISGLLRFVIHVGLWYFASDHGMSYFHLFTNYECTDPEMFTPRGLFGLILGNSYYIDPQIIRTILGITKIAWIAAAIGLFTDVSSAVTAIGTVFLQGYLLDVSGGNRSWYVPTAAFVAMAFSKNCRDDVWSVDYHVEKHLRRGPQQDEQTKSINKRDDEATASNDDSQEARNKHCFNSFRETGFARKCLLVYIVGFYFASGMAKLYSSGFRWADGNTLRTYLLKAHDKAQGKNVIVSILVGHPRSIGMLSATSALFLEAGACLAFYKNFRLFFLLGWALMHIIIKLTMGRTYEQNAWCYLLLVDWDELSMVIRRRINNVAKFKMSMSTTCSSTNTTTIWSKHWLWWTPRKQKRRLKKDGTDGDNLSGRSTEYHRKKSSTIVPSKKKKIGREVLGSTSRTTTCIISPTIPQSSAKLVTVIGTCLLLAMAAQAILQIEWWPFTNVDMYSSYRYGDTLFSYHKSTYFDPVAAQEIASSWGNRQPKGELSQHIKMHLVLRQKKAKKEKKERGSPYDHNDDGEPYQKMEMVEPFGVVSRKQWIKSVMTNVIVEDFRAKPKGTIAYDSENFPDNPASLFLLRILPSLKRNVKKWRKYDHVVLTYTTSKKAGPDPIIASMPLDEGKIVKLMKKIERLKRKRHKARSWWGGRGNETFYTSHFLTNAMLLLVAHLCLTGGVWAHVFLKSRSSVLENKQENRRR